MKTLTEFLQRKRSWPNNAYVIEPGFSELYVRDTDRYIRGIKHHCFEIANVVVTDPGRGTFTEFIKRMHDTHNLIVECVIRERFQNKLLRMGFSLLNQDEFPPSFYLLQSQPLKGV